MQEVQVASPDGKIKFTVPSPVVVKAERLTLTVTRGDTVVIEPSPVVVKLDGYDLSSGVVFNSLERYSMDESYPWSENSIHERNDSLTIRLRAGGGYLGRFSKSP